MWTAADGHAGALAVQIRSSVRGGGTGAVARGIGRGGREHGGEMAGDGGEMAASMAGRRSGGWQRTLRRRGGHRRCG